MFRRFGYALAPLTLAVLVVAASPAEHGGGSTSEDSLGVVKEVSGAFYGPPYNLVFPDPIIIEEPAANVPKECARWLGVWAGGKWFGTRSGGLIVHSVSFIADGLCKAKVTFAAGISSRRPRGATESGTGGKNLPRMFQDLTAFVYSGKELSINPKLGVSQAAVSYKMSDNGNTLFGFLTSSIHFSDGVVHKRMQSPYIPEKPATAVTWVPK